MFVEMRLRGIAMENDPALVASLFKKYGFREDAVELTGVKEILSSAAITELLNTACCLLHILMVEACRYQSK